MYICLPHRAESCPVNLSSFPTMSASPHQPEADSQRLKAEGNALFSKGNFSGAYNKYTSAIELDSQNAILYCNRAACAFSLGKYDDSVTGLFQHRG